MSVFIQGTSSIPVPETLGATYTGDNEESFLRSLQLHAEQNSRAINAVAQAAFGEQYGNVLSQIQHTISTDAPTYVARKQIVFATPFNLLLQYKVVFDIDTAPASTEEVFASLYLDGIEIPGAESVLRTAWTADEAYTLCGQTFTELAKDTVYTIALGVGIRDQSTGVVTTREKHSGLIYRLSPRLIGG